MDSMVSRRGRMRTWPWLRAAAGLVSLCVVGVMHGRAAVALVHHQVSAPATSQSSGCTQTQCLTTSCSGSSCWCCGDFGESASDSGCAFVVGSSAVSITFSGFGFSLPSDATVDGIQVRLAIGVGAAELGGFTVQLFSGASSEGNSKTGTAGTFGGMCSSVPTQTLGTATDLWGGTWLFSDINDIGVKITNQAGANPFLNAVTVIVDYDTPDPTATPTATSTKATPDTPTETPTPTSTPTGCCQIDLECSDLFNQGDVADCTGSSGTFVPGEQCSDGDCVPHPPTSTPTETPTTTPTSTPVPGSLGQTCFSDTNCLSGFCVDRVCCNQACSGPNEVCNAPGRAGLCTPEPAAPAASSRSVLLLAGVLAAVAALTLRRTRARLR